MVPIGLFPEGEGEGIEVGDGDARLLHNPGGGGVIGRYVGIAAIGPAVGPAVVKPVYHGVEYGEAIDEITVDRYGYRHERRMVCPQPFYMLSVWPNGDVASCEAIYKAAPLGNVAFADLTDMWSSDILKNFRIMQLGGLRGKDRACRNCCAPDDVIHPLDVLDGHEEELIGRLSGARAVS